LTFELCDEPIALGVDLVLELEELPALAIPLAFEGVELLLGIGVPSATHRATWYDRSASSTDTHGFGLGQCSFPIPVSSNLFR
jgi:hypothetical protein